MEQPEMAPDLVGRTSARLLAAGLDRRDRLEALHLLAILDASIDVNGRVRRPLDDLAAEFELPPMSVLRSLDHLELAGAVQRDGAGVLLLGTNRESLGGLQLADFLDDVRASFEDADDAADANRRRTTWLVRGGAALVAAATAVAVLTFSPSGIQQPVALRDASPSTTAADVVDAPDTPDTTIGGPADIGTSIQPTTTIVAAAVEIAPETGVDAAATCPTSEPLAEIIDGLLEINNPSDNDLVVTAVNVGGTVLHQRIAVPAGQTVTRDVALATAPVSAEVESWEWSNTSAARSCPS